MRTKQLLSKKNKQKRLKFNNISISFPRLLIIYLVTIGQAVALAQHILNTPKQPSNAKKIRASNKLPLVNNPPSRLPEKANRSQQRRPQVELASEAPEPTALKLPRNLIEKKFKEALKPYQAITPVKTLTEIGFQSNPHQQGKRYEKDIIDAQKAYPDTIKSRHAFNPFQSVLIRSRALTDPYYSLLLSKEYLQPSSKYSPRIAEIFILQAMLQASTPEEIRLSNQAYAEISMLDIPETLRDQLSLYRDQLISEYSLSNPGLCVEIREDGAIYSQYSDPELFECQAITISADREKIRDFLLKHPNVQSRLEREAVEKQNELASGTLAMIAMNSQNHILAMALDIQRILQYRKSEHLIRLYQFALRRLEKLLELPQIDYRDVEIITRIRFLEPYFREKTLSENEKVVFSKYYSTLELVMKKVNKPTTDNENSTANSPPHYLMSIISLFLTLLAIFKFRPNFLNNKKSLSLRSQKEKTDQEKQNKLNKGSVRKISVNSKSLEKSHSDNTDSTNPTNSSEASTISSEMSEAMKKRKYDACIARLKTFSEAIPEIEIVKVHLATRLSDLRKLSSDLSLKQVDLRKIQPKNKFDTDNLKTAESRLNQDIRNTNYALEHYEGISKSIDVFTERLNEIIQNNYSIDDITLMSNVVESLSVTYEIALKLRAEMDAEAKNDLQMKREQYESKLRMLDNFRNRARISVPLIANQVSTQLSRLQSAASELGIPVNFRDLDNASKKLLDALSDFLVLVNIDHAIMAPTKFEEHAQQVVEAENLLNPAHPLREAVESCYLKIYRILNESKPITQPQFDSMENPIGQKESSFSHG